MKFKTTDLPDLMHIVNEHTDADRILSHEDIADAWTKYFSAKEGEQVIVLIRKFEELYVDVHNSLQKACDLLDMHIQDVDKNIKEDSPLLEDDKYMQLGLMLYQYMMLFQPQIEESLTDAPDYFKDTLKSFKKIMARRMKQVIKEAAN